MLGLLFLQFRSLAEALIVLVSVPFALVGSFWTLYLLGYHFSAPVWVGLLSVVGLAMQTGVVMVVYIDDAFTRRMREGRIRTRDDIIAAHAEGTVRRLRPKIMTIATMAAGLLPLLWASGSGAEIMKRVAAPMIGGLVTSAFLTLEVIPVLYTIWRSRQLGGYSGTGGDRGRCTRFCEEAVKVGDHVGLVGAVGLPCHPPPVLVDGRLRATKQLGDLLVVVAAPDSAPAPVSAGGSGRASSRTPRGRDRGVARPPGVRAASRPRDDSCSARSASALGSKNLVCEGRTMITAGLGRSARLSLDCSSSDVRTHSTGIVAFSRART